MIWIDNQWLIGGDLMVFFVVVKDDDETPIRADIISHNNFWREK